MFYVFMILIIAVCLAIGVAGSAEMFRDKSPAKERFKLFMLVVGSYAAAIGLAGMGIKLIVMEVMVIGH